MPANMKAKGKRAGSIGMLVDSIGTLVVDSLRGVGDSSNPAQRRRPRKKGKKKKVKKNKAVIKYTPPSQ